MKKRIAIIGGGISGLTAAYVLRRNHADACDFTLFEANDRLGGIIETVRQDGFTMECGPDSWVTEKPWAEQLACELGLGGELLRSNDQDRRTYIAQRSELVPLPQAMRMMVPTDLSAVLESPLFSEVARRAYCDEPSRAAELRETSLASRGGDESVAEFVGRHFGQEVVDTVAGPLLAGVFGGDVHRLSARALLGPFVAMEADHGSLIVALRQRPLSTAPVFTTLASGLGTLVDRLHSHLPPSAVLLETPVVKLQRSGAEWIVESSRGPHRFDSILIATPLDSTRRLLATLPIAASQQAAGWLPMEASSSLIVALGYKAGVLPRGTIPAGFGFLVPPDGIDTPDLLACTFLHQKFAHRAPDGATLLRAFFASSAADRLSSLPDQQIVATARDRLSNLLGPLPEQADITLVRRWPSSLPQYEVGHRERTARFDERIATIPDLSVIGNSMRGVGLPDLIREATSAAHSVMQG